MEVKIANQWFEVAPFTDGDLIYLTAAAGNLGNVDRAIAEKNAAQTMRDIFPDLPPEWTKGDRLRPPLFRSTLAPICQQLQEYLLAQPEYQASLDPLKALGLDPETAAEINKITANRPQRSKQRNHPKSQYTR